jgi:hypothetical protein
MAVYGATARSSCILSACDAIAPVRVAQRFCTHISIQASSIPSPMQGARSVRQQAKQRLRSPHPICCGRVRSPVSSRSRLEEGILREEESLSSDVADLVFGG